MKHILLITSLAFLTTAHSVSAATIITASHDLAVRRNGGTASVEGSLHAKASTNNSTDRFVMLRFDSSDFGATVTAAKFLFKARTDASVQFQGTYNFAVLGITDGDAQDEIFTESGYDPNAAGALFDNSGDMIQNSQVTSLGAFTASAGTQVSLDTPALLSFLQADTNGTASLAVIRTINGGNSVFEDRGNALAPPRLELEVVPEPSSLMMFLAGSGLLLVRRRKS